MTRRKLFASKRYLRGIFGFFVFVVCCIVYRTWVSDIQAISQGKEIKRNLILAPFPDKGREGQVDVIFSAYMNSGSRFTGQLLGFSNDTFFFYEPLWKFTIWDYYRPPDLRCNTAEGDCRKVYTVEENRFKPNPDTGDKEIIIRNVPSLATPEELMIDVISNIYHCNLVKLKELVQERVHDDITYAGPSWQEYKSCLLKFNPKTKCLQDLEALCRSRRHKVVKVLRLTVASFRPLMEANPRLKIVHLVRDPRAIIHSRLNSRFYPVTIPRVNDSLERNLCDKMYIDIIEFIRLKEIFKGRLQLIYYEDITENLFSQVKQLYKFVNLTFRHSEVEELAKVRINLGQPELVYKYARERKRNNSIWWRHFMTWDQIQAVDRRCYKVYELLGYRILSEQQIRDVSYLSLQIPQALKL